MTQSLIYVEIDLPHCANVYGNSPCTASLTSSPPTGTIKCFNSRKTCQDIQNYIDDPVTLRFSKPATYNPVDIFAIPSVRSVSLTPAVVSLGKDLGQRASVEIEFEDHPDDDSTPGLDPYLSERTYNPYLQGTFWGKFRARNPFIIGSKLRLIFGQVGQDLADMETRHYIIDSYEGPSPEGKFKIRASDVLKLSDADKAQAPLPSNGFLSANITSSQNTITLLPSGVGEEYSSGYLNIGGSEIAYYWTHGDEPENVLLLHFDDQADASTVITDSSPSAHNVTAVGNAQIDTSLFAFSPASCQFDGTGDYLQLDGSDDFAFGTGDFTIDFWVRKNANGVSYILYDGRSTNPQITPTIYISTDNTLRYFTNGVDRINAGVTTTGAFFHVALTRQNGITRLFNNGVIGGSNYTDTNDYINPANRPVLGILGTDLTSNGLNGRIDEVRVTKGFARWTSNFTVPSGKAPITTDTLQVPMRGALNTTAVTHSSGDRAQHILSYVAEDPADIVYDLCTNYLTGFDPSWIDLPTWQDETITYNGNVYTGYVPEPTSVKVLLEELIEQAALAIWWDDINEQLRLQVLHAISTSAFDFTKDNIRAGSMSIEEQLDSRLSQVLVYFSQLNPLLPLSNKDNYKSSTVIIDEVEEDNWGQPAYKTILSRWIPSAGRTVADRLGAILLGRYKTPPRKISFEVQRYADTDPELGAGYRFSNDFTQDDTGAQSDIPIQVTELRAEGDRYTVRAEEMLFDVPAADLTNRTVTFASNTYNLNLRDEHDSIYPEPDGSETVTFTIAAGVRVGSVSTGIPAITVGTWPAGTTIILILGTTARIQGKGGAGASHDSVTAFNGAVGGVALFTRKAISLTNNGMVAGGGGGGGAAAGTRGSGGGGGSGFDPGLGGGSSLGNPGSSGTADAGGAGGAAVFGGAAGGAGGGPGLNGSNGTTGSDPTPGAGAGGASGAGVDGTSFVTYTFAGDIRGGQIN